MNQNVSRIKEAFEQPNWYLTRTAYNIRIRIETIREFLGGSQPKSILDIGCGNGSLSLHLLNGANRLTLLDQSQSMLQIALSQVPGQAADRVTTINSDFMKASIAPHQFDLILCVGVLAYVEERQRFVEKIVSALKPGGTVIIECTDGAHAVTHLVRGYLALKRNLVGDRFVTVSRPSRELLGIFDGLGFQLRGSFRYSLPLPGLQRIFSQKLSYNCVRTLFGNATRNRRAAWGNECLYRFDHRP
jgi:ubiquinone/menaquinone biosynthesis C-methylase UbiE